MKSSMWKYTIITYTENIETNLYSQESIDNIYTELTKSVFDEMDRYLDTKGASRKARKYLKFSKPYWNDNLTVLWKNMCKCEKVFSKVNYSKSAKCQARHEYKTARDKFDKAFHKSKRKYNRKVINDTETVNTTNPKEFWRHIKKLGPNKKQQIPMMVKLIITIQQTQSLYF